MGRPGVLREVVRRVHEADVRERLREVPEQASLLRVVLLREQPKVVRDAEQLLEQRARLVLPAQHQERVHEPERGRQEDTLAAGETVHLLLWPISVYETVP